VTDQRVEAASPLTHHGWLVHPAANRMVCFDGSLLHCVLPGQGPSPASDARRVTLMVAFWKEDPRAPPTPSPSSTAGGLRWPTLLTQPLPGVATSHLNAETKSKKRKKTTATSGDCDGASSHTPVLNNEVVILVDPVVEALSVVRPEIMSAKDLRESQRGIKRGVDLLEDNVFTYFEALNSGLVLSGKAICSLNCGGTCVMCRQFAAAEVAANSTKDSA
jgi:hypothetical protein